MLKRLPSKNNRSKGIRIKHVLQIFLLLGVCFWLIYQVKHSHDKRKEFDENNAKLSVKEQTGDQILKLGRKDLLPRKEEVIIKNDNHEEDEDEETVGEVEENKPEDELQEENKNRHDEVEQEEEENQTEETEDVGGGAGDDEIEEQGQEKLEGETDEQGQEKPEGETDEQEQEQEKPEGEVDREEGFIDEEKEREDEGDDKESEGNEGEDREDQLENENSTEDQNHDGGGRNTHEAREEHYKADDASSAVAHDMHNLTTENEKQSSEDSIRNLDLHSLKENKFSNTTETDGGQLIKVGEGQIAENGTSLDTKAGEEQGHEIRSADIEDGSNLNSTTVTESNEQVDASNDLMRVNIETSNNSSRANTDKNVRETMLESIEGQNGTVTANIEEVTNEQANNSNSAEKISATLTVTFKTENEDVPSGEESLMSSNHSETISEETIRSDTISEEDNSGSLKETEHTDKAQNEKQEDENELVESDESLGTFFTNENADPLDSSITQVEETRIDLDTLPDIKTEGDNSEDAAEE